FDGTKHRNLLLDTVFVKSEVLRPHVGYIAPSGLTDNHRDLNESSSETNRFFLSKRLLVSALLKVRGSYGSEAEQKDQRQNKLFRLHLLHPKNVDQGRPIPTYRKPNCRTRSGS